MTDFDDDLADELDINLRTPEEVGRRIVVLATLCRRAFLESREAISDLDEDPETERFDLRMWLHDHELDAALTPEDVQLLETPVGTLGDDEAIAATWDGEALAVLCWGVEKLDALGDPSIATDPSGLLLTIPAPWIDPRPWISAVMLRDEDEIARERERAEVWLWRADIEAERRDAISPARREIDIDIVDVVNESVAAGFLPAGSRGDFSVDGELFRDLPEDRIDAIGGIAAVRLHALNWLCGFGDSWDDVPLEIE